MSRLARFSDLPRIAYVAACGFSQNEVFGFERLDFRNFPQDTLFSYYKTFLESLRDPECIVRVTTATYNAQEARSVEDAIANLSGQPPVSNPVIIGVATWRLQPGSRRATQYQCDGLLEVPTLPKVGC